MTALEPLALRVDEQSQVSAARQACQRLARQLGFSDTVTGEIAIVVTEAATNMLRHAAGGFIAARTISSPEALGIEVLAVDRGPGIPSFGESARDGVSTAGTAGTGLGAIQRLSDEFDFYTADGGTVMRMVLWRDANRPPSSDYEVGSLTEAKSGETACGDAAAWYFHPEGGLTLLAADGLGHGPEASRAAGSAVEVLHAHPGLAPVRMLDIAHSRLRSTRGAAVAVVRHDAGEAELAFAGVGNISAFVHEAGTRRALVSHNGIVGQNVHKSVEYRYRWPAKALLVLHSDGLETHWELERHPGLAAAHPSIIAAVLHRDHSRKRDDAMVLVARRKA